MELEPYEAFPTRLIAIIAVATLTLIGTFFAFRLPIRALLGWS